MTDITARPFAGRKTAGPRTLGYSRGEAAPGDDAGVAGGFAQLGSDGLVVTAQLPADAAGLYSTLAGPFTGELAASAAIGTYVFTPQGLVDRTAAGAWRGLFWLDPAFRTLSGHTSYLALRGWYVTHSSVAPGTTTLAFSLLKYNGTTGGSALSAGSTPSTAVAAPTLNPNNLAGQSGFGGSGDKAYPTAAGLYFIQVVTNVAVAASSGLMVGAELVAHHTRP